MKRFADWRGVDKSQVSREVSPRYPDESIFWKFLREGLDPLHRADRATAERVWALLSRYNARYTRREGRADADSLITMMSRFQELLVKEALGGDVTEADLKDAGLRMLEAGRAFVDGLRYEEEAIR
jgi:hypothetical protein